MSKKVAFSPKPANHQPNADKWVGERSIPSTPTEDMKRLTIDIPQALHRKIKVSCAARGSKMADEIRSMLERHYQDAGNA